MNIKVLKGSWGVLFLALVVGGIAFYTSQIYLANKETSLREKFKDDGVAISQVVVATKDLSPGDVINTETMAITAMPSEHVSKYAITPDDFDFIDGRLISQFMSRGEPLLSHFIKNKVIERFSELLETGQRAVTLDIDEIASNSNMLTAGDYIDIFLLSDIRDSQLTSEGQQAESIADKVITPLLSRTRVIAIGPRSLKATDQEFLHPLVEEGEQEEYATITLGVDVEDAAKIELAKGMGQLVLMLRNANDILPQSIKSMDDSMVLSLNMHLKPSSAYHYYSSTNSDGGTLVRQYKAASIDNQPHDQRVWVKSLPVSGIASLNNKTESSQ